MPAVHVVAAVSSIYSRTSAVANPAIPPGNSGQAASLPARSWAQSSHFRLREVLEVVKWLVEVGEHFCASVLVRRGS